MLFRSHAAIAASTRNKFHVTHSFSGMTVSKFLLRASDSSVIADINTKWLGMEIHRTDDSIHYHHMMRVMMMVMLVTTVVIMLMKVKLMMVKAMIILTIDDNKCLLNLTFQVIFKCCKLIPMMIGGILIQGSTNFLFTL